MPDSTPTSMTAPSTVQSCGGEGISAWMVLLLATACGLIVANLYYSQPLVGPIAQSIGLTAGASGLVVTLTQIGYGIGLLLIVPLGDIIESRRLITVVTGATAVALVAVAHASHPGLFLTAELFVGLCSVVAQILVPYAAHMAPEAMRGRVVGNVMSGLLLGIMLARPVASFLTHLWSWTAIFYLSAALMAGLAVVLGTVLPQRRPKPALRYGALLKSMGWLYATTPVLRRRAFYQAGLFGAFSLFWTTVPLYLAGSFGLTQSGIALFALAGVAGAVAAPLAGRLADRGWSRPVTAFAISCVAIAFLMTHIGVPGSPFALAVLVAAAIVLDFGVSANLVTGQRAIFSLAPEHRSRLNGLYMATFFAGGALGSSVGGWGYAQGGWPLSSWLGFALPMAALAYFATERGKR